MKKTFLIILLIFLSIFAYSDTKKPKLRLIGDFWSHPFFYESSQKLYGTSFNTSLMCGMRIKNFSFGGEVTDNYIAMSGIDKDHGIKTGWNIVRGLVKIDKNIKRIIKNVFFIEYSNYN